MVHMGLANITGAPEFLIDKPEGDLLANAVANVMRQFDLTPDPKTAAIVGLLIASGSVYGPRAITYRMRKAQERAAETEPGTAEIIGAEGQPFGTTGFTAHNVN